MLLIVLLSSLILISNRLPKDKALQNSKKYFQKIQILIGYPFQGFFCLAQEMYGL